MRRPRATRPRRRHRITITTRSPAAATASVTEARPSSQLEVNKICRLMGTGGRRPPQGASLPLPTLEVILDSMAMATETLSSLGPRRQPHLQDLEAAETAAIETAAAETAAAETAAAETAVAAGAAQATPLVPPVSPVHHRQPRPDLEATVAAASALPLQLLLEAFRLVLPQMASLMVEALVVPLLPAPSVEVQPITLALETRPGPVPA